MSLTEREERERQVFESEREKSEITKKLKLAFKSLAWQHYEGKMSEAEFNQRWPIHQIHSMDYYQTVWYLMEKGFNIQALVHSQSLTEMPTETEN
ncbi:hypothetical protein QUB10_08150 [Microcoleus sp. B5-D4]|uniref:hypothetical protein n=1 Tax=unclassified Microcoleus TaxID=2642155 RepID=UPI002FCED455